MTKDKGQTTKDKLIVALDVSTAREAREIVSELKDSVGAFKIGMQLFTAEGPNFVRELTAAGNRIFLDLKFHDIPNTVANAGIEAARLGVWMFNVHAAGGCEMMQRTAEAVRETVARENLRQPKIIAVTVLTSSNTQTLRETGIENEPLRQVLKLARLTASSNLDGVVASPQEISEIRQMLESGESNTESNAIENFFIVTPGIRLPSVIAGDDQKRVMTPAEAIKAGADFLVVGRPILQARDKIQKVREILNGIERQGE
jgi:orotidine-5'-phosphate decarboxylase